MRASQSSSEASCAKRRGPGGVLSDSLPERPAGHLDPNHQIEILQCNQRSCGKSLIAQSFQNLAQHHGRLLLNERAARGGEIDTGDLGAAGPDRYVLLLGAAADMLRPGGVMVYAVCSLQEDEGIERINAQLVRNPQLKRVRVTPAELPGLEDAITPRGDVRTLPFMWAERGGIDGFYIARLTTF